MKRFSFLLAFLCAAAWCCPIQADEPKEDVKSEEKEEKKEEKKPELGVGDKAPSLSIDKWIKGSEVDLAKAKPDEIYVVEFWATWCPPCRASIPHLSEMQKHFKSKGVTFIGISNEKADVVKKFLDSGWDAKMQYTVALDKSNKTSEDWMEAAGQDGIPTAFVVKNGKIVFIGNPLADPLDEEVAKACGDTAYAEAAKAFKKTGKELGAALEEEDWDNAVKLIDKMLAAKPGQDRYVMMKYHILGTKKKDKEATAKLGAEIVAKTDDAQTLNELAWTMLTEEDWDDTRDIKLAKTAAKKAADLTREKDPMILDTYARALADDGDVKTAIEVQKKAIELCKSDKKFEQFQEDMEKALKDFETR